MEYSDLPYDFHLYCQREGIDEETALRIYKDGEKYREFVVYVLLEKIGHVSDLVLFHAIDVILKKIRGEGVKLS